MPSVLVVDDSAVDRRLVGEILQVDESLEVRYAADGRDALERIEGSVPDVVVTDLLMPELDGLELVAAVRKRFPAVPVILMTARGSEEIAVRALRQGAASYVAKRALAEQLVETVRGLLKVSSHRRGQTRLMSRVTRIEYSLVLDNDRSLLDPLIDYLQEGITQIALCDDTDRTRIAVALREALLNALYHGNLEVSSRERDKGIGTIQAVADERAGQAPYRDRRIYVDSRLARDEAVFVVRDEGRGFDPTSLPDPTDPANLENLSGRGVLLMKTFMDEVVYNATGNQVTLVKRGGNERGTGR